MVRRGTCALAIGSACWLSAAAARADQDVGVATEWRQTFMAPRITGNLRALAVDPTNPNNVYVGTEEGTLAQSTDGGVTWSELALSPFSLRSPTISLGLPLFGVGPSGDPLNQVDIWSGCHIEPAGLFGIQKNQDCSDFALTRYHSEIRPRVASPSVPLATMGNMQFWAYRVPLQAPTEPLLDAVAWNQPRGYEELVKLRACPGAAHGLFVATRTTLYGTDGVGLVPLFSARDTAPISDVICSPSDSNEVVIATGEGTYYSSDGGSTFDVVGGEFGTAASTALAFAGADQGGRAQLYASTASSLWVGDPAAPDGMRRVFVDTSALIRSIAVTSRSIWLATDAGVKVSHDGGRSWELVDDLDVGAWRYIVAVPTAGGGEHVAVLRDEIVMDSVDGVNFTPFFRGPSRRRNRQIVAANDGFYLLTTGELWTTVPAPAPKPGEAPTQRWASQRLARMPSLADTLQRALVSAKLTDEQIDALEGALLRRGWFPSVRVDVPVGRGNVDASLSAFVTSPANRLTTSASTSFAATVNLIWDLPEAGSPTRSFAPVRKNLYEIRKRVSFVIEDAYLERRQLLSQLERGGLDAEQLLTLEARVELLDTVLSEFTGKRKPE